MQNLYEVLGSYETIEEKREKLAESKKIYEDFLRLSKNENDYNDFVKSESGLFLVIKESILNYSEKSADKKFILKNESYLNNGRPYTKIQFIRYFLNKYGFIMENYYEPNSKFRSGNYIKNIETMEDIKRLLNCFYLELQQIDYYSMSKEELWERHKKFYESNKEWMASEKIASHHKRIG